MFQLYLTVLKSNWRQNSSDVQFRIVISKVKLQLVKRKYCLIRNTASTFWLERVDINYSPSTGSKTGQFDLLTTPASVTNWNFWDLVETLLAIYVCFIGCTMGSALRSCLFVPPKILSRNAFHSYHLVCQMLQPHTCKLWNQLPNRSVVL